MTDYHDFILHKQRFFQNTGFEPVLPYHPSLFEFQKALVSWAIRKGKAAIWAGCGLGKTRMQLEWARAITHHTGKPVLILAPLAVSSQTIEEGKIIDIEVSGNIQITNYEKLHKVDPRVYSGVVLDESSILKNFAGKFKNQIIESFAKTPFKLCCSATPSPNDYTEIGNHADFLNVCSRSEMLSTYFVHDSGSTQDWRLKGHAEKPFFKWLASWACMINKPSDIGFDDTGFILPPMTITEHVIKSKADFGKMFVEHAGSIQERRQARRGSITERCKLAAQLSNGSSEPWLYWCDLNDESALLSEYVTDSIEVKGADSNESKEERLLGFAHRKYQKLISKPKIAQFGMNWQHCNNVVFVGLSDSFEAFYQAVRRCWRFGQNKPVNVHIVISEKEGSVVANIKEKERKMEHMTQQMIEYMRHETMKEIGQFSIRKPTPYNPQYAMKKPRFLEVA